MKSALMRLGIIGVAIIVGYSSYWITKQKDSALEQAAEAVLRAHGVHIDISPDDK